MYILRLKYPTKKRDQGLKEKSELNKEDARKVNLPRPTYLL